MNTKGYKLYFALFLFALMLGCTSETKYIEKPSIQSQLNEANLLGAVVIYDELNDTYYSNDFDEAKRQYIPASTYKIPNTIIGLETGVIAEENHVFPWDSVPRAMEMWNADLSLREGFQRSCVPCYQAVARQIGTERMGAYIDTLNYGDMDIEEGNLDIFWLRGNSKISAMEQIHFLRRLKNNQLPIKPATRDILLDILVREKSSTQVISGKTGWASHGDRNQGWYVGFVVRAGRIYYFATSVQPGPGFDIDRFPGARVAVTEEVMDEVNSW